MSPGVALGVAEPEQEELNLVLDTADLGAVIAFAFVCGNKHLHCISNIQVTRTTKCKIVGVE